MSEHTNPKDEVRDQLLRCLYKFNQSSRSAKKVAVLPSVLARTMKEMHGTKQKDVASNLDYLVQKGWVTEVVEKRSFNTKAGTVQNSERRTYKISANGIDRLEEASLFQSSPVGAHVNITNINGVTVVGDGNVVNTQFTEVSKVLSELRKRIASSELISDENKLDAISDLDGISAQLQKPKPNASVIKTLWQGVTAISTIAGVEGLAEKAFHLLGPLFK